MDRIRHHLNLLTLKVVSRGSQVFLRNFTRGGKQRVWEVEQFPWIRDLESGWQDIRAELDELKKDPRNIPSILDIAEANAAITYGDQWKMFIFNYCGEWIEDNGEKCPKTAALLAAVPGLTNAMFSVMSGHTHIKAHVGPFKNVLRCHLGLIVPGADTACRLRVDQNTLTWKEGKCFVFDDNFEHEAWNDADHDRIVLILDFLRPLPFPFHQINSFLVRRVLGRTLLVRNALARIRGQISKGQSA